jgi:hypothetical protein
MKTSDQSSRAWIFLVGTLLLAACSSGGAATAAAGGGSSGAASGAASTTGMVSTAEGSASAGVPAPTASAPAGDGTGGSATGGSVTDDSHLADLLGPGDFAAAGVSGAGTPTVHPGDPGSVFVVYAGRSGGTGGIEFDAVLGPTADGMGAVFASMSAPFLDFEGAAKAALPEADGAKLRTDNPIDGGGEWAGIAFQKGRLVFLIAIPASPAAPSQLVALSKLVLERARALE